MGERFFSRAKYLSVRTFGSTWRDSKRDSKDSVILEAKGMEKEKGKFWASVRSEATEGSGEWSEMRPFGSKGAVWEAADEEKGIRVESRVEVWEEGGRYGRL